MIWTVRTNDGSLHTIRNERDIVDIVSEYMGDDMADVIRDYIDEFATAFKDSLEECKSEIDMVLNDTLADLRKKL